MKTLENLITHIRAGVVRRKGVVLTMAAVAALLSTAFVTVSDSATATAASTTAHFGDEANGIPPIQHVWFIILENKSFDATFTGLNSNTYLWKTLPSQGTLLTNYYGTGHFSLDNYIALASGQAPEVDTQQDCPTYETMKGSLITNKSDPNYGQFQAAGAPYTNQGCVYPTSVPTLFNQLDAAGVSWKGYAQDLGNSDGTGQAHDVNACGGPGLAPDTTPVANPGSANATDQYVPKHFPFPWFDSLLNNGTTDCNSAHIANLFDPTSGLYHDLQSVSTTPEFSWITPNNCSDAHDAVCHGNNLSGGFSSPTTVNPPVNYTGGLYASDLFLEHVIPEIEASPAFKQGGLIDIAFDEGFPAFTFTANSFNNSLADPATAATSIASDSAGQNIDGHNVNVEPTGPNTPLLTNTSGDQLYPGPGDNAFVDRDPTIPGIIMGGAGTVPGARTDAASADAGSTYINDQSIVATDVGRSVTGAGIPAGATVGIVDDTADVATKPNGAGCTNSCATHGIFELFVNGLPAATTSAVTSITLGAETQTTDPLYDATDATTGGGDVGSVLISPYIKPGSTDTTFYNHYSWLRTMEDLFRVANQSPGLDGKGHIGFAAQKGLKAFGRDVFNCREMGC